jgi:hypothetical protein
VWAGKNWADLAKQVCFIRQLGFQNQAAVDVVLSGSVYNGSPLLSQLHARERCIVSLSASSPDTLERAVRGRGVLVGMEQGGCDYAPLRAHLISAAMHRAGMNPHPA